jgi:H+/Na+-translocating ferredoxin:NAD+ oxidoreductase subunit G
MRADAGLPRSMLSAGLVLALFAAVATGLLALTERATRDRIADNRERALIEGLYEVVPPGSFDNDLHLDTTTVLAPEALGSPDPVTVYRARLGGEPVAAAFQIVAPNGYSGAIRLLIGVDRDGVVTGVRVVAHRETPGLGDAIDIQRSDWIRSFDQTSLDAPRSDRWAVRRDGGDFDQFTGATITPRAVVNAVKRALQHFRDHRDLYFAPATGESG